MTSSFFPVDSITFRLQEEDEALGHMIRLISVEELWRFVSFQGDQLVSEMLDVLAESLKALRERVTLIVMTDDQVRFANREKVTGIGRKLEEITIHLQAFHGINVRTCRSMYECGQLVGRIARALAAHSDDDAHGPAAGAAGVGFSLEGAVQAGSKKSSDPREIWTNMLDVIPGMSRAKAAAIVQQYPRLADLMRAYKDPRTSELEKQLLLRDIKYGASNKNIGPAMSEKVFHVFTSRRPEQILSSGPQPEKSVPKKKQKK